MALGRARLGGRPQIQTRPRWRAARLSAARYTADSDAAVQVVTDTVELANQLVQDAADSVVRGYEQHMIPFMRMVQREWPQPGNAPYASGYSHSRFGLEFRAVGDRIVAALTNDAEYAYFIKQRRYGGKRPAQRVVFEPALVMSAQLAEAIADLLSRES